jgi:hypothetical protein
MMTRSLLTGERAEEVFSEARLPAVLAKGGLASTLVFSLAGMAI